MQPQQVHIAFGENIREIVVTWSTYNATKDSIVEYGIGGLINTATGQFTLFVDGGPKKHFQYIHRVVLSDLAPDSRYGKQHFQAGESSGLYLKSPENPPVLSVKKIEIVYKNKN